MFLDADGATHYSEIEGVYNKCLETSKSSGKNLGCVIGNRNSGEKEV